MPHLFCFGFGYSARALARRLAPQAWTVSGTSRVSGEQGLIRFDRDRPLPADALTGATHILVSAPPDESGDPVLDGAREQLVAAKSAVKWLGYLSTTGIYGDHGGGRVDESTPPKPSSNRTRRRLAAENAWLAFGRET